MSEDRRAATDPGQARPGVGDTPGRDTPPLAEPDRAADAATTQAIPVGRGSTAVDPSNGPGRSGDGPSTAYAGGSETTGAREAPARPAPRPTRYDPRPPAAARPATRRRARLAVTRVDPWSVFVLSLLVSIFLGIVLIVAVVVLYSLLSSLGVLDSINTFAQDLQIVNAGQAVVSRAQVLGVAIVLAAVDVVLLTVLATLAAFLYNVCASLTGGIEVALSERD